MGIWSPPGSGSGSTSRSPTGIQFSRMAATGTGNILMGGTSITGGGFTGSQVSVNAPSAYLAQLINSGVCPCTQTIGTPNFFTSTFDNRFTLGAGWSTVNNGFGWASFGAALGTVGIAGTLSFAPPAGQIVDSFDIWYFGFNTSGTVQANVDGGAATPVNTLHGAAGMYKQTINVAAGSGHILNLLTITVHTVYIIGIDAYLSTSNVLHVGNAGVDGKGTSGNWIAPGTIVGAGALNAIQGLVTGLLFIELGGDDALMAQPPTPAVFLSNLNVLVQASQQVAGVILWSQPQPNPSVATPLQVANLASYVAMVKSYAADNNIPYADVYDIFGPWSNWQGHDSGDGVHPDAIGNQTIAQIIYNTLVAA
jgi:lysophospholipase L1-like esterase